MEQERDRLRKGEPIRERSRTEKSGARRRGGKIQRFSTVDKERRKKHNTETMVLHSCVRYETQVAGIRKKKREEKRVKRSQLRGTAIYQRTGKWGV